MTFNHLELGY